MKAKPVLTCVQLFPKISQPTALTIVSSTVHAQPSHPEKLQCRGSKVWRPSVAVLLYHQCANSKGS